MSTIIMFLTWLMSLVGLQPCETTSIGWGDCPDGPTYASQSGVITSTSGTQKKDTASFISNGL